VAKDVIEAYAYLSLAGTTYELARGRLAALEKQMSGDQIVAGKKRAKELQKEIDAKIAAKAAGK
jgi:predicted secreted protein